MTAPCPHVPEGMAEPRAEACEACGRATDLRACAQCGHVGCCESQAAHNTAHAEASGHPVIRSLPLGGGSFTWCYTCRAYV